VLERGKNACPAKFAKEQIRVINQQKYTHVNTNEGDVDMFNIGMTELILILVIALVVFGPGKLPEVGKALGKGLQEFRK